MIKKELEKEKEEFEKEYQKYSKDKNSQKTNGVQQGENTLPQNNERKKSHRENMDLLFKRRDLEGDLWQLQKRLEDPNLENDEKAMINKKIENITREIAIITKDVDFDFDDFSSGFGWK